ncbi:MAG: hypothetical protein ACYC35_25030 [Pirellulales bacterium]
MKTTLQTLAGCVTVALCFSTPLAQAGVHSSAIHFLAGSAALGQASASSGRTEDRRREVEDLLRRARQAMDQGNWEMAESCVARAEAANVQFGPLYFGDTAKKARRDLEKKRSAQDTAPKRPSQVFTPSQPQKSAAGAKGAAADPFLAERGQRDLTTATDQLPGAGAGGLPSTGDIALPKSGRVAADARTSSGMPPFGEAIMTPPADDDAGSSLVRRNAAPLAGNPAGAETSARAQSDAFVLGARRALATGDARRAAALIEQAKSLKVQYGPHEDSPAKAEATIRNYNDLFERRAGGKETEFSRRQYANLLMEQSQALLRWREFDEAERLAGDASRLAVNYGPFEAKPQDLLGQIASERKRAESVVTETAADGGVTVSDRVIPAGGVIAASGSLDPSSPEARYPETRAIYDPSADATQNIRVSSTTPAARYPDEQIGLAAAAPGAPAEPSVNRLPAATAPEASPALETSEALRLFQEGEDALRNRKVDDALRLFRQANDRRGELDAMTQQRLQDHLQLLSVPAETRSGGPAGSLIDAAAAKQQLLAKQVSADVARQVSIARKQQETNPKQALATLQQARKTVEASALEAAIKEQLLRRVDRDITELSQFIETNRSRIELDERNAKVHGEVEHQQLVKVEVQEKLALLVDQFNRLMDEQRYAEAEVVAKQAGELDPRNPVVTQLQFQAKFVRRFFDNMNIRDAKEENFVKAMQSVDKSSIPFDDYNSYRFPDVKEWTQLTKSRGQLKAEGRTRRSEKEIDIERKLKTPVSLQFTDAPLSQVLEYLAKLGEVNLHLDPQGMALEGVTTDTPVTINLSQDISMKSALHLILDPLHLSYIIKDEVLKITSEEQRSGETYRVMYPVADLVTPIPNFIANPDIGLSGALRDAYGKIGFGAGAGWGGNSTLPPIGPLGMNGGTSNKVVNPAVLAQMNSGGAAAGAAGGATGNRGVGTAGPGGLGGGQQADFDSLIELITTTIAPTTWTDAGGVGSIAPFETNLSLVVSQTQEVHEDIVDLLQQLRRLQDLQVTIEVRFITLSDNFFERIGMDFDFDIKDSVDRPFQVFGRQDPTVSTTYGNNTAINQDYPRNYINPSQSGRAVTVGMTQPGLFSADLDIPFTQNSFGLAVPQFGGFDATAGAQLGFAILSDIEAYFFINAAQGDRRTNVLQAPKVTLFNGQSASVSDMSQSPFVISVIPVVGDFAAAQQPVIIVLSEGTYLTVQAVISNDRRFVRLTVVPFFSQIGDVRTFQFTGSSTTVDNQSSDGKVTDTTKRTSDKTTTTEGTTVQLPTFSFVTVTTTVSVPDGGTVLLGGIKRLSEGRNEFGVPILNKIPYINRLFKNVGIGRETQSLMMMVTPRIIIQEEEEEKMMGGAPGAAP